MKSIFGVLSLLVVLAIVGSLASKQLRALEVTAAPEDGASAAAPGGTPAQQSKALQRQVADDVNRLIQQAPARLEGAEQ
ncbi:hypothetical protein [Methylibium sp.]|uniref:hypothetical protein n=1 Tax=Methylibium sp. TaxID=2067992 RepID=UPI0017C47654|nr:hypothetical protein [Methylibium sp.]MBA3589386.1 hypothetical protein [Methylibium sp.]